VVVTIIKTIFLLNKLRLDNFSSNQDTRFDYKVGLSGIDDMDDEHALQHRNIAITFGTTLLYTQPLFTLSTSTNPNCQK